MTEQFLQERINLIPEGTEKALLGIQVFTANGTYTPSATTQSFMILAIGAGGAGGGAVDSAFPAAGDGGGAGGVLFKFLDVVEGEEGTVIIGAGGVGAVGVDGPDGGATSITYNGTLYSPGVGRGGDAGPAQNGPFIGSDGAGGIPGFSDYEGRGGRGQPALYFDATVVMGGSGGASYLGAGGGHRELNGAGSLSGLDAITPGSGGGGAVQNNNTGGEAGGDGADGIIVIYEYG